jgi:hypothetical protein
MNLGELINLARLRLRDKQQPYLWDDETLTEFANSAVEEACIRARLLVSIYQLSIVAGVEAYALPTTTLLPKNARFVYPTGATIAAGAFKPGQWYTIVSAGTTNFTLVGASANTVGIAFQATGVGAGTGTAAVSSVAQLGLIGDVEFDQVAAITAAAIGTPVAYKRGAATDTIHLYPTPSANGRILIDLTRVPTAAERLSLITDAPVIPAEFHRDLVYWMQAEAYTVYDTDGVNVGLAEANERKFEARFGRKITARGEAFGRKGVVGAPMYPSVFGGGVTSTQVDPWPSSF